MQNEFVTGTTVDVDGGIAELGVTSSLLIAETVTAEQRFKGVGSE